MKKVFIILILTAVVGTAVAQTGLYIGYENGFKMDKFNYVNSMSKSLTGVQPVEVLGGYLGYKFDNYTIETGFYSYGTNIPVIHYDFSTGEPSKSGGAVSGTDMGQWVIPVRFGKEFHFSGNNFFIKPEISFNTFIAKGYSKDQPIGGWGENISFPGNISTSTDSTLANTYGTTRMNFGIEPSILIGYRIKEKFDISLKGSYNSCFSPLYYETITHYSSEEIVTATNTFYGNAFLLQIGVKYFFAKREKKE
jgi:hypothetical protein